MRPRGFPIAAACVAWVTTAHAIGPPAMVHTKDGSVYYGELVERVEKVGDEHVTILLATGVVKRFALKDIDPSPIAPPLPPPPREEKRAPTATVRTKNGSVYHGELIERVVDGHVTLKLETDEVKTIDWSDVDLGPPPPPQDATRDVAPVENVTTKNGSVYHGEIVEKVVRDHVTLKLATDEVKTVAGEDIIVPPPPMPRLAPTRDAVLDFWADDSSAILERRTASGEFEEVCRTPCREVAPTGTYRATGKNLVASPAFDVAVHSDTNVVANMGSQPLATAGMVLTLASIPVMLVGLGFAVAAASAPSYVVQTGAYGYSVEMPADNSMLNAADALINIVGATALITGIVLMATSGTSIRVNGRKL